MTEREKPGAEYSATLAKLLVKKGSPGGREATDEDGCLVWVPHGLCKEAARWIKVQAERIEQLEADAALATPATAQGETRRMWIDEATGERFTETDVARHGTDGLREFVAVDSLPATAQGVDVANWEAGRDAAAGEAEAERRASVEVVKVFGWEEMHPTVKATHRAKQRAAETIRDRIRSLTPPAPWEPPPVKGLYLIFKAGRGFYRPNAQGYTMTTLDAGRFTLAEAEAHTHPNGPDGPRDGLDYMPAPEARDDR